jgi:hypothetical protein
LIHGRRVAALKVLNEARITRPAARITRPATGLVRTVA